MFLGSLGEHLHRPVADTPLRNVDDPAQTQHVARVVDDAQVRQDVLHLFAFIEPQATDDGVGNRRTRPNERLLYGSRLGVRAIQYRDVAVALPFSAESANLVADPGRLRPLVVQRRRDDGSAFVALGPEFLALALGVVLHDRARSLQYRGGGSVVLLQPDDLGIGIVLLEIEYVLDVRAPPSVDRLVVVAHGADVVVSGGEVLDEQVLRVVGILVLVDEQVVEPALPRRQHVGMLGEKPHRQEQQVVEVDGVVRAHLGLIFGVEFRDQGGVLLVVLTSVVLGALEIVLRLRYRFADTTGLDDLLVQSAAPVYPAHERLRIVGIVDREVAVEAHRSCFLAKDSPTDGVKRAHPDLRRGRPDERADPLLHLLCGLVREGYRQDSPRWDALIDEMREAVSQRPGLAAPRSRKDEYRTGGD